MIEKGPPTKAIEKWLTDKGIKSDIPNDELAKKIAKKISINGTEKSHLRIC